MFHRYWVLVLIIKPRFKKYTYTPLSRLDLQHFFLGIQMIAPFTTKNPQLQPSTPGSRFRRRLSSYRRILSDAWFKMQVTHYGGKYSIERMLALEEYTRTTSLGRVLLVLFISPLPVVVLLLSQESIPLQDPRDGWRANYGFWIRFAILQGVLGYSAVNVIKYLLDGAAFSLRQMIQCSIYVGSSYTVAVMVISAHWAFPIPFVNVSVGLIWIIFFALTLRIVAGSSAFWRMISQREQLLRLNKFCTIQILMTTFYPAYQVLFNTAKHTRYELPVILILPIVKLIMKSVLASTIVHKEDTVPEQVILTIDFFDALYLATFMQSLSDTTVVVIMAIDLAQSAVDLRELHQRTKSILKRLHNSGNPDTDILTAIRSLCCHPELIREQVNRNIQVHSCIAHTLSLEAKTLLEKLKRPPNTGHKGPLLRSGSLVQVISRSGSLVATPTFSSSSWWKCSSRKVGVAKSSQAVIPTSLDHRHAIERAWLSSSVSGSPDILHEALEALFTAECLVLTEYLETMLPVLYGNAVLVMVHLPSAQYHTEMDGVTQENVVSTMTNVYIYAMLEFVSFVVFVITVRRNCGLRALHHIAFILETQTEFVQTKLMLWTLMTMTYRVVHFGKSLMPFNAIFVNGSDIRIAGADFSFKFAWINH